jgi:uncharacterized protein
VIIHANEETEDGHKRIETFVVGHNIGKGERLQWTVPGGNIRLHFCCRMRRAERVGLAY